jgi:hypothetical protein
MVFYYHLNGPRGFICLVFQRVLFLVAAPLNASSAFSLSLFKVPLNTYTALSLFGVPLVSSPSALYFA